MWRRFSRLQTEQPLLLFLALGLLLFAADAALRGGAPAPAAPTIVVGGDHAARLLARIPSARERTPAPAELRRALGTWIEEEALAREARAIGLDAGDVIVRRRLAQKMRAILSQLNPVPEPDDAALRELLEADPARYGEAARVSFEQVFLSRARHGGRLAATARAQLERVRGDGADFRALGDAAPTGPVASDVTLEEMARRYGRSFAEALRGLPVGPWRGPLRSSLGMHLVRVTGRTPFRAAPLEEVREALARDWRVARRAALDEEALDELIAGYAIEVRAPEEEE